MAGSSGVVDLATLETLISTIRTISTKLENLESTLVESKVKSNLQVDPSVQPIPTHIRLEVPRFDGNDPLGWIFKVNQFFDYHRTANE